MEKLGMGYGNSLYYLHKFSVNLHGGEIQAEELNF